MIEYIETSRAAQAGRSVKLIEGTIEPTAVEATATPALEPPKPKSRPMLAADAAVRPRERKPRKVPSSAGTWPHGVAARAPWTRTRARALVPRAGVQSC